ncbi:MAG: heavy metal translocating P-type ATPase, partial [Ferruginibacter sp.]
IDERDDCIKRITQKLKYTRGVEKVHIIQADSNAKSQLCFHYDPQIISVAKIEEIAKQTGADILMTYGHILLTVSTIRNTSHARNLEFILRKIKGVLFVSASVSGFIQIEFEKQIISSEIIYNKVKELGLNINKIDEFKDLNSPEDLGKDSNDKIDNKSIKSKSHVHSEQSSHEHSHSHGGVFGKNTELILSLLCGAFLAIGFTLSFFPQLPIVLMYISYSLAFLTGGYYALKEAIVGVFHGNFEIDFLMIVAAIGAAALGHYSEGALLLFLFSLGHSLEHYAMEKAKKSIASLSDLTPKIALLKKLDVVTEVKIESLLPGDIIVVKPNSHIAADGIIVSGNSAVNQAPITGESKPVIKEAITDKDFDLKNENKIDLKSRVFAGTINGTSSLEIMVSKLSSDSTISRMIKLVNEAQTQKSDTQNFTDKVERFYVPAVLILVTILLFVFTVREETFGESFYRAMAVLVAASPCALAIATPSAVLSGVARAAKRGILIKGGKPLEQLGLINVIAFDKTGTLTEGKPKLKEIFPLNNFDKEKLYKLVTAMEATSDHPLAAAIVSGIKDTYGINSIPAKNVKAISGMGISGEFEGNKTYIGNVKLFQTNNFKITEDVLKTINDLEKSGHTTMLVGENAELIGVIALVDTPREDAKDAVAQLAKMGMKKMIMLSGDNQNVANTIAGEIGITEALGSLMPEQKIDSIKNLLNEGYNVAMIGDGVNDAPAMATANVWIAM